MKFAFTINLNILFLIGAICIMLGYTNEGATRIFMFSYWAWMIFSLGLTIVGTGLFLLSFALSKSQQEDIKKSVQVSIEASEKRIFWKIFNRLVIIATIGVLIYIGYTWTAILSATTFALVYFMNKFFTLVYK